MHGVLLAVHVSAAIIGLSVGGVAMAAPKLAGRHTALGPVYQGAVAVMTASAVALVALAPGRLWGYSVIAVATEASALTGWVAGRRRRPGWLAWHIIAMASSYLSFVTAALVVNSSSPLAWILPTLVGSPLIARTVRRHQRPAAAARTAASAEATSWD